MTAITKDAVPSHDLQSSEVIGRLKRGELLLMDQIASRPYAKIVRLIDSELPTAKDWDKIDENLKWVLHTQIAALAGTYVIEDLINTLIDAEEEQINGLLEDLIYRYFFVSQDLSAVFFDFGHSTWNLVDFLDPDYFFGLRGLPPPILAKFGEASSSEMPPPPAPLNRLCERLIQKGLDRPSVQAVKESLAEWIEWTRRYRLIIASLYEADDPQETIYAFHYAVSIVTRLLAVSLSMKLLLKPLKNQWSHLSGRGTDYAVESQ
jgi:hypothetical protein